MRKYLILFISIILLPINVLAYSNYIYAGGDNVGITVSSEGILVIGFYENNKNDIKMGDYIIKVNDINVNTIEELVNAIETQRTNDIVNFTIRRKNKIKNVNFKLRKDKNTYKTGLYVKDQLTGIGTLTYIDPTSKIYGALGHEIIEANSKEKIEVKEGTLLDSYVTDIDRSTNGTPGAKNAKISSLKIGSINKNTNYGIYGFYEDNFDNELVEVGNIDELKLGKASIKTVLKNKKKETFDINITKIDKLHNVKNIYFKITDKKLLNETGGIVQGMSGSPIIQDNKIYGAVTHVVVDDVTNGYGIFITTMLIEGDKLLN